MKKRYYGTGYKGLESLANAAHTLLKSIARERRRHISIRELTALSDRTLKDIGLHRSEIPSVVNELVHSKVSSSDRIVAIQRIRSVAANDNELSAAA